MPTPPVPKGPTDPPSAAGSHLHLLRSANLDDGSGRRTPGRFLHWLGVESASGNRDLPPPVYPHNPLIVTLIAGALTTAILLTADVLLETANSFDIVAWVALCLICVGMALMLYLHPVLYPLVSFATACIVPLFIAMHLTVQLPKMDWIQRELIISMALPWIPVCYVLLFLLCRLAVALAASIPVFLLLNASVAVPLSHTGVYPVEKVPMFVQLCIAQTILILMLGLMGMLRSRHFRAWSGVERLAREARTDVMTGLLNRRACDQLLKGQLQALRRRDRAGALPAAVTPGSPQDRTGPIGLMLVDIDLFKRINDTLGHQIGDEVIISVARLLAAEQDQGFLAGRWGGEEFLVITPAMPRNEIHTYAERLRSAMRAMRWPAQLQVTISIGITLLNPQDAPHKAVERADIALYRAKERGRDRIEWQLDNPAPEASVPAAGQPPGNPSDAPALTPDQV